MKKPNVYLFSAILLILTLGARAQDISIGARGGFSIPNLSAGANNSNPLNTGYSSRLGADVGLFAEFKFSDLFSIQPMVEYSSQGGKKDGLQAFPTPAQIAAGYQQQGQQAPPYLYANYNSAAKLNYLMVPILAKFGWTFAKTSPWRIYVDAGPFVGFLLSAHQVTSGMSPFYADAAGQQELPYGTQPFDGDTNIKDQLHTVNLGAEANVGLRYKFGSSAIFIEGGGNYGFLNIQKGTANGKNETGAATADIGYSYWFGKTK
jgi:hypothetical protein